MQVNIGEAKARFSRLVARACAGEEVVIAKAGKPVARVVPILQPRWRGTAKGQFIIPDDFNDPLPKEIEDSFWESAVDPPFRL